MKLTSSRLFLLLLTLLGLRFAGLSARADEIGPAGAAPGLAIHGPEETLSRYCSRDSQGRLWLALPGGARYELVTSTSDPSIANPGDGSFHPFDELEVRAALAAVRYPLENLRADVFILPFPRRLGLESAAGPELILLSPGVRALSREQQHAEFVHELGHVVQHALMPDWDMARWGAYRRLRGIEDTAVYSASAAHADRPHEIFAEDFRALFGGPLARYSGTIENSSLQPPSQVQGLDRFILELMGAWPTASRLAAYPNPSRGPVRFSRPGGSPAPLDLFDVSGRRVATLDPIPVSGGVEWRWGGLDTAGRALRRNMLFARVRGEPDAFVRVALLN